MKSQKKMKPGKVFLVGAGPGDPGLITVRGLSLVQSADVLVYDALGAGTFIEYARPDAELIDAGKRSGKHTLTQEEINSVLVKKAKEGKTVVRLKGGDPMIFGRGGEELEFMLANGVKDFEVVPGISSSIAGPVYAGIPVTHRRFTSEVAIVTGHEADIRDKDPSQIEKRDRPPDPIPWKALAPLRTLVFLMGVRQLPQIVKNLLAEGKSKTTPVALIEQATTPLQRTVTGTLETICKIAEKAEIKPPSIIVIGKVVGLRETLSWFEKKPLFGKKIVVTRSRAQAGEFCRTLETLGAKVFPLPTIRIEKIKPNLQFEKFLKKIDKVKYLIFTSVNGVEAFWENFTEARCDARDLYGKKIICIGPVTAEAFERKGIFPDFVPQTFVAEHILPYFNRKKPEEVAILRAETARDILPDTLRKKGWTVEVIVLYRTVSEKVEDARPLELLKDGKIDAVTFTSSSTVDHFMTMVKKERIKPATVPAVSIGPITSDTCRENKFKLLGTAKTHTIPGLVEKLLELFKKKR